MIQLSTSLVDEMLELKVFDDAPACSEMMINNQNEVILVMIFATGSTNPGLYFRGQVASMHRLSQLEFHDRKNNKYINKVSKQCL